MAYSQHVRKVGERVTLILARDREIYIPSHVSYIPVYSLLAHPFLHSFLLSTRPIVPRPPVPRNTDGEISYSEFKTMMHS